MFLSLGGWMLHFGFHPISGDPPNFVPFLIGLVNVIITPPVIQPQENRNHSLFIQRGGGDNRCHRHGCLQPFCPARSGDIPWHSIPNHSGRYTDPVSQAVHRADGPVALLSCRVGPAVHPFLVGETLLLSEHCVHLSSLFMEVEYA